jgi:hypothetical protein
MQCACAILLFVSCMFLLYFSTLSRKRQDFWKDVVEHKYVLTFSTNLSETFLTVTRTEQDIINVLMSSCEVPVILVRF